jgi:hypothetical protein
MLGIIIPISVMAGIFLILFASALIERLVYKSRIKKKREIAFRKEKALREIALFNRELEEKRQKRNAYMREYRKKKKEANK